LIISSLVLLLYSHQIAFTDVDLLEKDFYLIYDKKTISK